LFASICLNLILIAIKGKLRRLSASFHLGTKFNAYLQHHCKELLLSCNSQARGLGRRRLCRVEFFGRSAHRLCPNWQLVWWTCRCTVMTSCWRLPLVGYYRPTIIVGSLLCAVDCIKVITDRSDCFYGCTASDCLLIPALVTSGGEMGFGVISLVSFAASTTYSVRTAFSSPLWALLAIRV